MNNNAVAYKKINSLEDFRELIYNKTGIYVSDRKDYLLEAKFRKLVQKTSFSSLNELVKAINQDDRKALDELINAVTTNHTFFFREAVHLKILKNDIMMKRQNKIYIWVAASSTGEEVYSIIITLLEAGITNFIIIASDIKREALLKLKKGIYPAERMKEVSSKIRKKYFIEMESGHFKVTEDLKKYMLVKQLNLMDSLKFERNFDYIFCRNVLMYFDRKNQEKVINMLKRNLLKNGYLFVGHSEGLFGFNCGLQSVFNSVYSFNL